jgi:hypothetical protein
MPLEPKAPKAKSLYTNTHIIKSPETMTLFSPLGPNSAQTHKIKNIKITKPQASWAEKSKGVTNQSRD